MDYDDNSKTFTIGSVSTNEIWRETNQHISTSSLGTQFVPGASAVEIKDTFGANTNGVVHLLTNNDTAKAYDGSVSNTPPSVDPTCTISFSPNNNAEFSLSFYKTYLTINQGTPITDGDLWESANYEYVGEVTVQGLKLLKNLTVPNVSFNITSPSFETLDLGSYAANISLAYSKVNIIASGASAALGGQTIELSASRHYEGTNISVAENNVLTLKAGSHKVVLTEGTNLANVTL